MQNCLSVYRAYYAPHGKKFDVWPAARSRVATRAGFCMFRLIW